MPFTSVKTESGEGWCVVRLSSPDGLNRLGTGTLNLLYSELNYVLSGDCRCLAVVGEGRSFAVGADLREIGRMGPDEAREFSRLGNGIFHLLERCDAVVVAGIDGFCLGGGLDLALSADWRIATGRSVFGHPGADLGLVTGFGGTQRLPRLAGRHRAAWWLYTGEKIPAREAYGAGVLQEICSGDTFENALLDRVEQFAARPVPWIREVKQSFRLGEEGWRGW